MYANSNSLRSTFRRAVTGAVMLGAATLGGTAAHAGDFTHEQCRLIAAVATDIFKAVGSDKLSTDFRGSFVKFVMPKWPNDLRWSESILTPLAKDIDAFNVIRAVLLSSKAGGSISLEKAGLRSVDPATLAARRPADGKHSELNATPTLKAD